MNTFIGNAIKLIKLIVFIIIILTYILVTIPFYPFFKVFPERVNLILQILIQKTAQSFTKIFSLRVTINDPQNFLKKPRNYLIVSNHLSYIDVIVFLSYFKSRFVTSKEIRNTFFLGQICELAGCLFIDRKNRRNIAQEIKTIAKNLSYGHNVTIFPEATSTDGATVYPFKKPFFKAATLSNCYVLPITINYESINNQTINNQNKNSIFWYGNMAFFPHLWNLLGYKTVSINLTVSQPLLPSQFKKYTSLAKETHQKNKSILPSYP